MKGTAKRACHAISFLICKLLSVQARGSYSFTAADYLQAAVFVRIGHILINHFLGA